MKKNYVLVLSSGGLDSAACITFYKKLDFEVEAFFVDYGQLAKSKELKSIVLVTTYYEIPLKKIAIKNLRHYNEGLVPGRNALLHFLALQNFERPTGLIASGIHGGTDYFDCSPKFVKQIQELFDGYSSGAIRVDAPFLNFTKREIFEYCKIENIPIHLTYSCELGKKQPCGICATCKELEFIYESQN